MEISPFFVYVILKLDSFCSFMCFCSAVSCLIGVLTYVFGNTRFDGCCISNEEERKEDKRIGGFLSFKVAPVLLILSTMFLFVWTITPSTKQAAVIWLLPKITTEQNLDKVQSEAGELYDLAKQWLKEKADSQVNRKAENDDQANQ